MLVVDPDANKINWSATYKFEELIAVIGPSTYKAPFTRVSLLIVVIPVLAPMFNVVAAPAKLIVVWLALSKLKVVVVVAIKSPPVNVKSVNVGESDVVRPNPTVDPATPFVVNIALPCDGDDNTDADTIPVGTPVNPE